MILKRLPTLSHQADFDFVFKKGKYLECPLFKIRYLENNTGYSRFSFIISKQIDKRATVRNKIRRKMREWIRTNQSIFQKHSLDIIFFVKKEALISPKDKFYEELFKITRKIFS